MALDQDVVLVVRPSPAANVRPQVVDPPLTALLACASLQGIAAHLRVEVLCMGRGLRGKILGIPGNIMHILVIGLPVPVPTMFHKYSGIPPQHTNSSSLVHAC